MPDASGAPAPKPTSWADYLSRLKLARATRRREDRKHRPLTAKRVAEAETLLARIIDGSDLIAEVALRKHYYDDKGVCLLVTMTASEFRWLCQFGAKLEDDEENGDDEPSWGGGLVGQPWGGGIDNSEAEPSLGSCDAVMDQTYWSWGTSLEDDKDNEPSLGSCDGIVNQERWHDGHRGDEERDTCDDEANGDDEPGDEREPSLVAAEGANANLRALPWEPEADTYQPPEKMAAARARYVAAMVKP